MKKIVLATLAALAATSSAAAEDMTAYGNAAQMDWSGFYAGVFGGYGGINAEATPTGLTKTDIPVNGALLGVTVGVNQQVESMIFGLEGDLAWSGQSGSTTCNSLPTSSCKGDMDWTGSLRVRAGYTFDSALIYATAGTAFTSGTATVTPPGAGTSGTFSDTWIGWTLGGGVEYAVNDMLSVKGEYAYSDYGTRTAPAGTLGPNTDLHMTSHSVKFGLNYHF